VAARPKRYRAPSKSIAEYVEQLHRAHPSGHAVLAETVRRKPAPVPPPPTATELARDELAVRLRNLESLCEEVRGLVEAAGEAATAEVLRGLCVAAEGAESALEAAVGAAAEGAGLEAQG
jgi:hypothetical protein